MKVLENGFDAKVVCTNYDEHVEQLKPVVGHF